MFATDRDLLALEPLIFRDALFLSQRLTSGTCSTSESTLDAAALDPNFLEAGVTGGHVVAIDGTGYEVIEVSAPDSLKLSRLRAAAGDDFIPPAAITSRPFTIDTFAPQLAAAQAEILRLLDLAPMGTSSPLVNEAALLNPADFRVFAAQLALRQIVRAAGTLSRDTPALAALRQTLEAALQASRHTLIAQLDLNGDGQADSRRRIDVQFLLRM